MDSHHLLLREAIQYHQSGQLSKAEAVYRHIIQMQPRNANAIYYLGVLASQVGNKVAATELIRQAISIDASHSIYFYNLGEALQVLGRHEEAIDAYQSALRLDPNDADSLHNLGRAWQTLGRTDQAIECYQFVLQMRPNDVEAQNNLGGAYQAMENYDAAIACYRHVLALKPDYVEVLCNLGSAYKAIGKAEESKTCYLRALSVRADSVEAMNGLLIQQQELCEWNGYEQLSERLITAVDSLLSHSIEHRLSPLSYLGLPTATTAQQQFSFCKDFCNRRFANLPPVSNRGRHRAKAKIRIGYLSGDFRTHPVAYSICQLLEFHDRKRFDVFGYSFGVDDQSAIRRRVVKAFDSFSNVRQESYRQTAKRIVDDEIDILIDLMGHTFNARTEILAMRPAPIQIQFLGYAGTMGLREVDYVIADRYVVPDSIQEFFQEKLLRLPNCFFPVDTSHTPVRQLSRSECGLPDDAIVLGSFNNSTKITPTMLSAWLRILRNSQNTLLWIYVQNDTAEKNLTDFIQRNDLSMDRIRFARRLPSLAQHLSRYALMDLFLDTYPYNAHSTTVDALKMGCPVVTLTGNTFASRVAGSMLQAVELPQLITNSLSNYEKVVTALCESPAQLRELRRCLENKRHDLALFNSKGYAESFDSALQLVYQRYVEGLPPTSISIAERDLQG